MGDPSEPAKAWVEVGSCADDDYTHTFSVRLAETRAEEDADDLAPSLYSDHYETEVARDAAVKRVARALGLEVR